MTASDLASLASAIYGPRWQSAFARDFDTALRTVQRWARDGIDKPATAGAVRRFLEERARLRISPPPADGYSDRDDDAYDEFRPRVEALAQAGEAAGWHPAEAVTAILAVTVDMMRAGAGDEATVETLEATIAAVRADATHMR